MPSIKHPTSFTINEKNYSNIMVERDDSIACQQNSKEPETKKQTNHNHRTKNLTGNKEADKNNRQQYQENKILQLELGQQQRRNTTQVDSKEEPLQDKVMTKQKNKKANIIGDSMIKKIDRYLLTSSINHKYLVKVRSFLAAKTVDMFGFVKPIQRDLDPEAYVIHMKSEICSEEICSEIFWLIEDLKTENNTIVVSTIVPRGDAYNTKVEKVNTLLKEFCENNGIYTISHDNVNVKKHLNKRKLHLNDKSISSFVFYRFF